MAEFLDDIYKGVLAGDLESVERHVNAALRASLSPEGILTDGLIAPMAEAGQLFEDGEYFVPELLVAARAMKAGLALLKPLLVDSDVKPAGTVVAGTVKGDLHDIGKNLVCMMLEGAGFEVVDLGVDVSSEQFVEAVRKGGVDIIAMSALLTTTMVGMKTIVDALESAGLRGGVRVIVGGAPVTNGYAEQIGADGYSPDASQAVRLAKSLLA
jgi:5-methyltetrahydrofolate--homocysteine methyltransferase